MHNFLVRLVCVVRFVYIGVFCVCVWGGDCLVFFVCVCVTSLVVQLVPCPPPNSSEHLNNYSCGPCFSQSNAIEP